MAICDGCFTWDRERKKHQMSPMAAIPGENCTLASGSCEGTRRKNTEEQRSRDELNRGKQIIVKVQTLLSQDHCKRQAELSERERGAESLSVAGQSLGPSIISNCKRGNYQVRLACRSLDPRVLEPF